MTLDNEPDVFSPVLIDLVETIVHIAKMTAQGERIVAKTAVPNLTFLPTFRALSSELARCGILRTRYGFRGGLELVKEPDEISIGFLARIIKQRCKPNGTKRQKSILPMINVLRERVVEEMDKMTIADLLGEPQKRESFWNGKNPLWNPDYAPRKRYSSK